MIQRIQTIYLFAVVVLSVVCMCSSVGLFSINGAEVADFSNFAFNTQPEGVLAKMSEAGPFALGILLILVIFLSIVSICLFRKRLRQIRLTVFSSILLVGWCLTYAFFMWVYFIKVQAFANAGDVIGWQVALPAIFPVLCLILNSMAIHGIRRDEALVRSLDRIR